MGVSSKNRKRKANSADNKTPEEINENEVSITKTKKSKKHNSVELPIEEITKCEVSPVKNTKSKKNKSIDKTTEELNKNSVSKVLTLTKKAKENKLVDISSEEINENESKEPKSKKKKKNISLEMSTDNVNENKTKTKSKEVSETSLKKKKKRRSKKNKKQKPVELTANVGLPEEIAAKYPLLNDSDLVNKYLAVPLGNNKKGRIRQILKGSLQSTSDELLPDIIHNRMQLILKAPTLTDSCLRKLRVLHNMLRTALQSALAAKEIIKTTENGNKSKQMSKKNTEDSEDGGKKQKEKSDNDGEDSKTKDSGEDGKPKQKVKGPKRYVVFIGNLPLGISEDKIKEHFSDISDQIKDVRIPNQSEEKKSAIAYLEVTDYLSFELALSKHHTMFKNKRINVLYSSQRDSKLSKAEAKGKAAKLVALKKSGKLAGSVALTKKRSARRKKKKLAEKVQEAAQGV